MRYTGVIGVGGVVLFSAWLGCNAILGNEPGRLAYATILARSELKDGTRATHRALRSYIDHLIAPDLEAEFLAMGDILGRGLAQARLVNISVAGRLVVAHHQVAYL